MSAFIVAQWQNPHRCDTLLERVCEFSYAATAIMPERRWLTTHRWLTARAWAEWNTTRLLSTRGAGGCCTPKAAGIRLRHAQNALHRRTGGGMAAKADSARRDAATVLYSTLQYSTVLEVCNSVYRQTCAMRLSSTDLPAPLWPTTRSLVVAHKTTK